jgi:type IX secretion system PorP/SprF family membrane protein
MKLHLDNFLPNFLLSFSYTFALLLFTFANVFAQDVHLTQFYHATTYINPAFAGTTPNYRVTALYRNQWAGIPDYQVGLASFDYNLQDANSGIGVLAMFEKNGSTGYSNTNISGQYSFKSRLGDNLLLNLGVQASFISRSLDFSRLKFEDQIRLGIAGVSAEKLPSDTKNAFDVSGGALLYSEKIWFGIAAHHLTRPSMSILGSEDKLPMRLSAHIGGKFILDDDRYANLVLMPAMMYTTQAPAQQMMLGTNLLVKPLIFGAWYRGFPLMTTTAGTVQQDAIALFAGFTHDGWTVGYSYDFTISGLTGAGGSHEITLSFAPLQEKVRRGTSHIPCPITF